MHDRVLADATGPVEGGPAASESQEALSTVGLGPQHAIGNFCCSRSERVTGFLRSQAATWVAKNYCRVFVIPDPDDPARVLGYYTLSSALLMRSEISTQDQKKVIAGLPVPLVRIGFMGRDDSAERGLGASLIVDAARRVHRNPDIAAWGLVLDSEGGEENPKLMTWYESVGFKRAKTLPGVMYGSLTKLRAE